MKVQIKKEVTEEIDFPVPSYWEKIGTCFLVEEDKVLQVGKGIILIWDNASYKSKVESIVNDNHTRIDEVEFLSAFNKTMRQVDEVMKQPAY